MMTRLERLQALAVCVSECNCVCIQRVYMCGCVHNACVTGLCRWLLCVCMRVYIVQGWDMDMLFGFALCVDMGLWHVF